MASRYRIVRRLQRGGTTELYEAFVVGPQGFERRVALRPLRWASANDRGFVRAFVEEAERARRLRHPNVVGVLDFGALDDVPLHVLEFVDGLELASVIHHLRRAERPIPAEIALTVTIDVADGLAHAHLAPDPHGQPLGLVHQGLKPESVIIGRAGEVRIGGFGLAGAARQVDKTAVASAVDLGGYSAPEQIFGGTVDPRADLFALGCLLQWLLTGTTPLDAARARATPGLGAELDASAALPPDVRDVVHHATRTRLEDRFADATSMADACRAALSARRHGDPRANLRAFLLAYGPSGIPSEASLDPKVEIVLTRQDDDLPLRRFASVPPGPPPAAPPAGTAQGPRSGAAERIAADEPVTAMVEAAEALAAALAEAPVETDVVIEGAAAPAVAPPPDATGTGDEGDDPLVGTLLQGYRIEAPLGIGALARVYRARHCALGRCAVKVLYGAAKDNERAQERLRREAQTLGRLRHPHIVSVVDSGATPQGYPFLTMELVEGRTLRQIIASEAPMPGPRVATIARQVADALTFAHELGVVHRDVKPGNVMVDDRDRVKVLDFGIARIRADAPRLTVTHALLGTPRYMAPEQILGAADVGPAADLYALGVLMYAMLAGEPPFVGDTLEVVERQLSEPPPPLSTRTGLEPLVMQLLSKKASQRPVSGAVVLAAIDALCLAPIPPPEPIVTRTAAVPPARIGPVPIEGSSSIPPSSAVTPALGWPGMLGLTAAVALVSAVLTAWLLSRSTPSELPVISPSSVDPPALPAVAARPVIETLDGAAAGGRRPDLAADAPADAAAKGRAARNAPQPSAVAANAVRVARRRLRDHGLTRSDVRRDPVLDERWRALRRAARRGDRAAVAAAQRRLDIAMTRALTPALVRTRMDAFARRLRSAVGQLEARALAQLEDRYLDLRASAVLGEDPEANAQVLRRLSTLEAALSRAMGSPPP